MLFLRIAGGGEGRIPNRTLVFRRAKYVVKLRHWSDSDL